jgi:hypothetical protein
MRRKDLSVWAALLLAVALAVVFAAGCGGDDGTKTSADTGASASPAVADELTPQEIVDQSTAAMNGINSASFTADFKLDLEGDASKMSDPTAQQLLSKPVTLHMEGASSTKPQATDMDVTVSLMGQDLQMTVLSEGKKAWVEYEDTWYAVPQENTKALGSSGSGALPTEQLGDLGLDPQKWDVEWELIGTETYDGAEVYHLKATPDPKQIADDLMKALEDPDLYKQLGDPQTAEQLKAMKTQNAKELKDAQKALEDIEVQLWIETGSMYLRQGTVMIGMNTEGMEGAEGVTAMNMDVAFTMADFDEPVEVKAPANAKDFDTLMNELVGGMMGSSF